MKIKMSFSTFFYFSLLFSTFLVASFLRLYNIRDYIVFLGDEGRDALVWLNMVNYHKFTLLGPTASVGGFYLGPIYYYLALPFYYLARDPVGPALFVAAIGIATVYIVWDISQKWFGRLAGLVAAITYSTAALIIRYSRSSWNPNPLPFFSLLGLYWISNGTHQKKTWQLIGSGICLGIAWQLHYLALILTPIYIFIIIKNTFPSKKNVSSFISQLLFVTLGFTIGFAPFFAFEIRHQFPNTKSVIEFITRPGKGVFNFEFIGLTRSITRNIHRIFYTVFSWPSNSQSQLIATGITLFGTVAAIRRHRLDFLAWFYGGMIIFSLYQGSLADYYYGFLFPAPFILFGASCSLIWKLSTLRPLVVLLTIFLVLDQSGRWFLNYTPNRLLIQTENISRAAEQLSEKKPYNFALITAGNSDHAYRYFLEKLNSRPTALEKQITDQLIVICEKPESECQPLGNPIWEIAGFGRAEIDKQISLPPGIIVYKLTHYHE